MCWSVGIWFPPVPVCQLSALPDSSTVRHTVGHVMSVRWFSLPCNLTQAAISVCAQISPTTLLPLDTVGVLVCLAGPLIALCLDCSLPRRVGAPNNLSDQPDGGAQITRSMSAGVDTDTTGGRLFK